LPSAAPPRGRRLRFLTWPASSVILTDKKAKVKEKLPIDKTNFLLYINHMQLPVVTHRYKKICKKCAKRLPGHKFPKEDWYLVPKNRQYWAPRKKICWDCYKKTQEYQKTLAKSVSG
jgi:hypothetical protein